MPDPNMDLNKFDKLFKSSLENLEESYDASNWSALENRLNAGFSEEHPAPVESVDLAVKRALDRLEVPYQSSDWQMLSDRLNQIAITRRIRITKIAEAVIFLLLLINIEGFLGGFKEVVKPSAPVTPKVSVPIAHNGLIRQSRHNNQVLKAGVSENQEGSVASTLAAMVSSAFGSDQGSVVQNITDISALDASIPPVAGSMLDGRNFYNSPGITRFDLLAPVPVRSQLLMADLNLPTLPSEASVHISKRKSHWYSGSFASYNRNQIASADYHTAQNSGGVGIQVGARKGLWGLETGLSYSNVRYAPKRNEKIYAGNPADGFLASFVKQADGDVFVIPVKVTRRIAKAGNTTIHAVAGVSANLVAEKSFQFRRVVYPPVNPSSGGNGIDPTKYAIPDKKQDGLLEGGSLPANSYVTADLGMRLETPVGKRYIAFVEPSYHRALNGGFGPDREKIHSFSIQAGVLASL